MFGPGAAAAVETYRRAKDDPVLQGLLALFGSTASTIARFEVRDGSAIARTDDRRDLVQVPVTEPVMVRPGVDRLYQIRRHNTP